jgi:hypothetical protein
MAIMVGENYKLEADKLNIILLGKSQPTDEKTLERMKKMRETRFGIKEESEEIDDREIKEKGWHVEGYFGNLSNALKYLLDIEVKKSDLLDLQFIVKKINEVEKTIEKVCPTITVSDMMKDRKRKVKGEVETVEVQEDEE